MPKKGIYNIGFISPHVINENSVKKWPNRIENDIFMALDKQHTCTFILFPYIFKWVLRLSSVQLDNKYIYPTLHLYVYQQLPLDLALYRDRSGPSCCARLFEEAKRRLSRPHSHHAKGMGSLPQKTHRRHVNCVILISNLTFRYEYISHIYWDFFKCHEYFITHLYIVFETEGRKQPMWLLCMWVHALLFPIQHEDDATKIRRICV